MIDTLTIGYNFTRLVRTFSKRSGKPILITAKRVFIYIVFFKSDITFFKKNMIINIFSRRIKKPHSNCSCLGFVVYKYLQNRTWDLSMS